jgi:hypothetical protein|tara:strand:- start:3655 stop:3804 length:150 start_codon:yes stop_codon:yes gene_type:complete
MDWDQDFDSDQDYFEYTLSIMVDQLHAHLEDGELTQAELTAQQIKDWMQ